MESSKAVGVYTIDRYEGRNVCVTIQVEVDTTIGLDTPIDVGEQIMSLAPGASDAIGRQLLEAELAVR